MGRARSQPKAGRQRGLNPSSRGAFLRPAGAVLAEQKVQRAEAAPYTGHIPAGCNSWQALKLTRMV